MPEHGIEVNANLTRLIESVVPGPTTDAKERRVIEEAANRSEALRKRGVEVQYMVKKNESHGFRNEENRFDSYGAMEKFFTQHLRP